jgi:hypothetical protein
VIRTYGWLEAHFLSRRRATEALDAVGLLCRPSGPAGKRRTNNPQGISGFFARRFARLTRRWAALRRAQARRRGPLSAFVAKIRCRTYEMEH